MASSSTYPSQSTFVAASTSQNVANEATSGSILKREELPLLDGHGGTRLIALCMELVAVQEHGHVSFADTSEAKEPTRCGCTSCKNLDMDSDFVQR